MHHLRTHIHFNQVHTLPLKSPGINIVVSEKKDGGNKNKTVLVAVDGIHFTILKPGGSGGEVAAALHAGEMLEKVLGVPSELRSRASYNSTFDLASVFVGIQELPLFSSRAKFRPPKKSKNRRSFSCLINEYKST